MQTSKRGRPATGVITPCALLVISIGLSGCSWWEDLEPGENFADAYGELAGFCGFLQDCGGNGNGNMGNRTGSSSPDEGSSDEPVTGDDPDATAPTGN
jgi:hypothetical protein